MGLSASKRFVVQAVPQTYTAVMHGYKSAPVRPDKFQLPSKIIHGPRPIGRAIKPGFDKRVAIPW